MRMFYGEALLFLVQCHSGSHLSEECKVLKEIEDTNIYKEYQAALSMKMWCI